MNHNPTDPNSTPLFDEWGWGDYWSMQDWLTWHGALKQAFGQPLGNDKFVNAWNSRSGFVEAFGDSRADWLAFNTPFRDHLKNHQTSAGISMLEALEGGNIIAIVTGTGSDIVSGAGEVIGNVGGAAANTSKTLRWLLPAILITAAILAAVYVVKKYNLLKP